MSVARALGTILIEKILDVLVLLVLLGILTSLVPVPPWMARGVRQTSDVAMVPKTSHRPSVLRR